MRKVTDTAKTVTELLAAMDAQRAVTIRYVKADGTVSRRGVEILAVTTTANGDTTIVALDRRTGERRTFRVDRITHLTCHRAQHLAAYRVAPIQAATGDETTVTDPDTDEVVGFRAWVLAYVLAA